jgi:dTDP-4-dehydrorhamnose 3,5-epimerase
MAGRRSPDGQGTGAMKVTVTRHPEVLLIQPDVHRDERGFFLESFSEKAFRVMTGLDIAFVQDNHSRSCRHVLRGLHYQVRRPQGKLVRVIAGSIFDVAVDLRRGSPHFLSWVGIELTAQNHEQLWIPPGFAHGFLATSEFAEVLYKTTDYYAPEEEETLRWDDPTIAIRWSTTCPPILSLRDQGGGFFPFVRLPD